MKRLTLSVLMILGVISAMAQWRSTEEASAVASSFLKHNPAGLRKAPAAVKPKLAFVKKLGQNPLVYAFDLAGEDGYVLVSGNENSRVDVLGYADKGRFDEKSMSDGMKWLLESYASELESLGQQNVMPLPRRAEEKKAHPAIAPLIKTHWGQGDPYNRLCPPGMLTGCVPTAISQLCYYYQYPTHGTGNHSYKWKYNGQTQTLSADFSKATYEWDKMKLEYKNTAFTEEEGLAVAQIASHVGVAVEVNYGPRATSGSYTGALKSLLTYFGFDDDMYFAQHVNYSEEAWEELVYSELDKKHPVLYEGQGGGGGHAFIVDGYEEGLFHLNWGWEGNDDGYFYLSSLVPSSYASVGGFTKEQSAYFSVVPADDQPSTIHAEAYKKWTINRSFATKNSTVSISGNIMNCCITPLKFTLSAIAVDQEDGSVTKIPAEIPMPVALNLSSMFNLTLPFNASKLTAGHFYEIIPILLTPEAGEGAYMRLPLPADSDPMILEVLDEGQGEVATNGEEYPRRMLVEQVTGTWVPNCVEGMVAADYMKQTYPDNFININIHYNDEMEIFTRYNPGLTQIPTMMVNRKSTMTVNKKNMEKAIGDNGKTAGGMVKIDKMIMDDKKVSVTAHARFNHDAPRCDYRLIYVILEDKVGPYIQKNAYAGLKIDMGGWEKLGAEESTLFNDVARSIYPSINGTQGKIPLAVKAGEDYSAEVSVSLPDNIQNYSNLSMVVILYDDMNGEVVNAEKMPIANPNDAIRGVTMTAQDGVIYSLGGQKLSQPQKGINIVRTPNGQVRKILVK